MRKDHLVKETDCLKKVLKKASTYFGKILCVVNSKSQLVGCLTSGDIRRAILSGYSINSPIKNIYNRNATFLYNHELKKKKLLKSNFKNNEINNSIFYVPIINKKKNIIKILSTNQIIELLGNKRIFKKKSIESPKILVVGGAGYIGSNLCSKLLKKNFSVKVVDKLLYDKKSLHKLKSNKKFEFLKSDICDLNTQVNAIKDVDAVVFLAEIVGDPACNAKPEDSLKTNYLSIVSMSQLCSYIGISKFVYTSSCSVYGADESSNLLYEKSNLNPLSHYARMKIMSEKALLANKNEIFKPTILRLGTVFGLSPRNRFDLVVNKMAKNAFFEKKIDVYGGLQWRPNIHVDDVSEGIIAVLNTRQNIVGNQIFNLSSDKLNLRIKDIAFATSKVFKKAKININSKITDERNYKVSSKKFYIRTKFKAKKNINYALKSFFKFFKKNKKFNPKSKKFSNLEIVSEK